MSDNLRLNRVCVKNLFGRFTYDINLDNGYDIAILIAPNGCGKTTIFRLINFMFKPSIVGYKNVATIPFDSCECTLSNGKVITMKRKVVSNIDKDSNDISPIIKRRNYIKRDRKTAEGIELSLNVKGLKGSLNITKELRNILEHIEGSPYFDEDLDLLDLDDLEMLTLPPVIRSQLRKIPGTIDIIKDFLIKNDCNLAINFIRADRLHLQGMVRDLRDYRNFRAHGYDVPEQDPLIDIQNKTRKFYKEILDEYNSLQREMKDRLPRLYLDSTGATMGRDEFVRRWNAYVQNIKKYCEIGLLNSEQTILDLEELEDAYDKKQAFLTVYLEAFEKTLEPLERNYARLKLFADILNRRNRVTHKVIKYGEDGVIITVDGSTLSLDCLSSGEKNDFIMFYKLIFDSEKNGLVLIDEPEISLHIEWQEEYLDCLLNICAMNDLQAIIATHSPNIVNGHFELYAERGLTDGCC